MLPGLTKCPGALGREAEALRIHGKMTEAAKVYEAMLERDPSQVSVGSLLVNAWISLRRFDDATALLKRWPRSGRATRRCSS